MSETPSRAVELFFSYAHEDKELRDKLEKHLSALKRQHVITSWHDRMISAGEEWRDAIDNRLAKAQIILLLVSPDFMNSDYCWDSEVGTAMTRHENGYARVIPVILRPVFWQGAPFGKLQALPEDGKPVVSWQDVDEALLNVAVGIKKSVEEFLSSTRLNAEERRQYARLQTLVGRLGETLDSSHRLFYFINGRLDNQQSSTLSAAVELIGRYLGSKRPYPALLNQALGYLDQTSLHFMAMAEEKEDFPDKLLEGDATTEGEFALAIAKFALRAAVSAFTTKGGDIPRIYRSFIEACEYSNLYMISEILKLVCLQCNDAPEELASPTFHKLQGGSLGRITYRAARADLEELLPRARDEQLIPSAVAALDQPSFDKFFGSVVTKSQFAEMKADEEFPWKFLTNQIDTSLVTRGAETYFRHASLRTAVEAAGSPEELFELLVSRPLF